MLDQVLTEEQVVTCLHMLLRVDVVGSHTMVASPTRGVPIGEQTMNTMH